MAKPPVLFLKLLETLGLIHLQATILFTPAVVILFRYTEATANLSDRLTLRQGTRSLLIICSRVFLRLILSSLDKGSNKPDLLNQPRQLVQRQASCV